MQDWTIEKRITLLTGGMVMIILFIVAFAIMLTVHLSANLSGAETTSARTRYANEARAALLRAEAAVAGFRLENTAARQDEILGFVNEFRSATQEMAENSAGDAKTWATLNSVREQLSDYVRLFTLVADLQDIRDGFVAAVAASADAAGQEINRLMMAARSDTGPNTAVALGLTNQELILARLAFEGFLVDDAESSFEAADGHVRAAEAHLAEYLESAGTGLHLPGSESVRQRIADFWSAANDARAVADERRETQAQLTEIGASMTRAIGDLAGRMLDEQAKATANSRTISRASAVLLASVGVATALFGGLLAVRTGRAISTALRRSLDDMKALADGELDLEIDGVEAKSEFGDVSRALIVFRNNAIEARELARQRQIHDEAMRAREQEREANEKEAEANRRQRAGAEREQMIAVLQESIGHVVESAAAGDFSQRVGVDLADPELARIADGINRLIDNVETGLDEVVRVLSVVATGDLTERVTGKFSGTFAELQRNVNDTILKLASAVREIARACDSVIQQATEMSDQAQELACRAEQQATSLEQTSVTMEEIATSARASTDSATSADAFASGATEQVDRAGDVVAAAVAAMADIRNASTRIDEIVSVIDGIAFQTNLLALNASVEAARAGEAGKGFAVVASEVRALAQRSGAASKDIKALIDESAGKVARGVELVESTGVTLDEIVVGVRRMAESMRELMSQGEEQAVSVEEVTNGIAQLDVITQKNAALADQGQRAAGRVRDRARGMREIIAAFRTSLDPADAQSVHAGTVDVPRSTAAAEPAPVGRDATRRAAV